MDPLNLLVARQNAADQVRETVEAKPGRRTTKERRRARSEQPPTCTGQPCADGSLGPAVQVAWRQRLTARFGRVREIGRAATRRRVTVLR